ncbi:MAG: NAD(P)H-hydrate dehydratase [Ruminococcaceae bacterium]|nr:NAD(P)H-hydrate dehydratase [Oscillospiraceae bacterium]
MSSDKTEQIRYLANTLREREPMAHKGTYGTLTVVAGSRFYRGAASLAVTAALRCGVGLVRLASCEEVIAATAAQTAEAVFLPLLATEQGGIDGEDFLRHLPKLADSRAILAGCGMTDSADTGAILRGLLYHAECPLILDADGLNVLKACPSLLREAKLTPVITPHVGEMARLTGKSVSDILADRRKTALDFSREYNCVTVLKDAVTAVASPEGEIFVCDAPNSGLAKGGSGDVLAGITASLVCQGYDGFTAASCAVTLHSLAASYAAEAFTEEAMLPSDLITMLPRVFDGVRKERISR